MENCGVRVKVAYSCWQQFCGMISSNWQQRIMVALVLSLHRFKAKLRLDMQALVECLGIEIHLSGWKPAAVAHFSAMEAWRAKQLGEWEKELGERESEKELSVTSRDVDFRNKCVIQRESALGMVVMRHAPSQQSMGRDVKNGSPMSAAPGQAISGIARASAAVAAA